MKKVYIIGQMPPPVHGLSKALDVIIRSELLNKKFKIESLDIKNNKLFFYHLIRIFFSKADLYYFTVSQTIFGNIRDMIIIFVIKILKKEKLIIHYHGGFYKKLYNEKMGSIQKIINKILINKIDKIIVLSEGLKHIFYDVVEDKKKIAICENFIEDVILPSENILLEKLDRNEKNNIVNFLFLSNFIKSKGYLNLLLSIKLFSELNPTLCNNCRFHFAGHFFSEKEKNEFIELINSYSIKNLITYHGSVYGSKKESILLEADVFVLPTFYPKEGQPISIIEAMGNGNVIISTKHAGIPDLINNNNGFLLENNTPHSIMEVIDEIAKDKKYIKKIGLKNYQYTISRYKEIHYIKNIESIFMNSLLGRKS